MRSEAALSSLRSSSQGLRQDACWCFRRYRSVEIWPHGMPADDSTTIQIFDEGFTQTRHTSTRGVPLWWSTRTKTRRLDWKSLNLLFSVGTRPTRLTSKALLYSSIRMTRWKWLTADLKTREATPIWHSSNQGCHFCRLKPSWPWKRNWGRLLSLSLSAGGRLFILVWRLWQVQTTPTSS